MSRQQKSCAVLAGCFPPTLRLVGRAGFQPVVSYRVGTVPLIGYGTLDLIPKKVVKWLRIPSTSACLTYEPVLTSTGRGRLKVLFTLSRIPLPRAGFR